MKHGHIYFLSNHHRSTLYIGVTSDLERRVLEHKSGMGSSFTSKYNLTDLMYYEVFQEIETAIKREKQLKNWHKEWKWNLVKSQNPDLQDLAAEWFTKDHIKAFRDAESSY